MYDVIIVGWGPTGMTAANLLGRAGHRVAVFERYRDIYPLPRVGGVHDDIFRIFQEIGIADRVFPYGYVWKSYDLAHDGEILFSSPMAQEAEHGWPQLVSLFQPYFEREYDSVARRSGVEIFQGQRVIGVAVDGESVSVAVEDAETQARRCESARFLIACDGGNSVVRDALSFSMEHLGFDQDWLVVDGEVKRERAGWPEMRQMCDRAHPGMTMRMGQHHRRWAFMVHSSESLKDAVKPESVWRRLDRPEGATPGEINLIRHAAYRFTAKLAECWRKGAVFLAGDAAHLMPPYLGQGMCSGIRDAQNLAFKLDLVLSGLANARLLDSYELERKPNCRSFILESVRVGRMVIEKDPEKVRKRDEELRAAQARSTQQLGGYRSPPIAKGFIASGERARGAGAVFVQGRVDVRGKTGRFDDLVGRGFMIVAREGDPRSMLSDADRRLWESLGGKVATFGAGKSGESDTHFVDAGGRYGALLDEAGCNVVVKRPDFHVFGMYPSVADLPAAMADFRAQLG